MKKATLALALGLLIGSATTAIAATDTVQATIAKFKFVVNGEQQQLKNDPLVRNGVTYLPVRETAELLGAQVDFKDGTITLDKDGETVTETTVSEWIAIRDLSDQIKDNGGIITFGGELNKMTINLPGHSVSIDSPTFKEGETERYFIDGTERYLTIKFESGTTYFLVEELDSLGVI